MRGGSRPVLLLLLPFAAAVARADEAPAPDAPTLRVLATQDGEPTLSPRVKVGEPFHVIVTIIPRPDVLVSLPADFPTGSFEVVDRSESTPPGAAERTYDLTVVAWEPGKQTFPAIPVTYVPRGEADLKEIKTAAFDVEVTPVVVNDEAELRPIAPPVSVYERDLTLVTIAGSVVGTMIAGAAVWLLFRKARRRRAAAAAAPALDPRAPHEIALEKLGALAESSLLQAADRRPFYFALSEIAREYLGRRFGFAALDMTSSELCDALAAAPEAAPVRGEIAAWLSAGDLVKFARVPATLEEARAALAAAVRFVEASKPLPPPPSPPGAAAATPPEGARA
jgi:hypothetical protein